MRFFHPFATKLKSLEKDFAVFNTISLSRAAMLHNFDFFSGLLPSGNVIPVLKSNAYGHGIEQIATILKDRRPPYIAVDGYYEALRVRRVSKQPVLIMGAIDPTNFARIHLQNYAFVVHDLATIAAMAASGKQYVVHIEIETGMHRHGVGRQELPAFLEQLKLYKNVEVEGVMTHLADADNPASTAHVELQTQRFDDAVELVRRHGFAPRYIHIAQSAGSVKVHSRYANTLRVGIALYGVSPLEPQDGAASQLQTLRPVLTLTSTITKIMTVSAGESVSYGRTFTATRNTQIAVLPLGYYEGLPRSLSNSGHVTVKDALAPIAGRVCMNHTMIDVTDSAVEVGDRVTVISADTTSLQSVQHICETNKLFNYSLLVGLNQNIRRQVVD